MNNRELINKFLAYLKVDGRAVLTLSAYATDLKQWEKILGGKRIIDLSKDDVARLPSHFAPPAGRASRDKRHYTNNSLARKMTSVREFLRWGYRKGYLKNDLAKEIEIPRSKTTNPPAGLASGRAGGLEPLSANKLYRLRRAADVKERLVLELILGSGMRLSQIVKIRMKDVKFSHCEDPEQTCGEPCRTSRGRRGNLQRDSHATSWLGMTDSRRISIKGQLQQALEYYLATYTRGPRSTLIFSQRTGREITERTASNILRKLVRKAGLKDITAKDLRNTFILNKLKEGISASEVAKRVGYESLGSIQRYLREF